MAWFPMFTRLEGRRCLIAGGGSVALRKAETLLSFGGAVRVVSPDFHPGLAELPVELIRRRVDPEDAAWASLVVDATGDPAVGEMLYRQCAAQGVPINVVDQPDWCTFIFPALLRRGELVAGISTGGASPTAAVWARDRLADALPEGFEAILAQMQAQRVWARGALADQSRRGAVLKACFALALERGRPLTEEELRQVWADFL